MVAIYNQLRKHLKEDVKERKAGVSLPSLCHL